VACSDDEAQRAAKGLAEAFQHSADPNDLATLHRLWSAETRPRGWEKTSLQRRLDLGQRRRTSLEYVEDVTAYGRIINLNYNVEFERGEAWEPFSFLVDGTVPRLVAFQFFPGKRYECFPIGGCSAVDVPQTAASR
jgi:hypothetical protein